jgi:cell division protein ZapE
VINWKPPKRPDSFLLMPSSPLGLYTELLESGRFKADPHQLAAVNELNSLWHQLQQHPQTSLWNRLKNGQAAPVKGIYLWGGVGRGKTWLMDLFYESLPNSGKQRIHFHRFMQRIHSSLNQLKKVQDPLVQVAQQWAKDCRVLCLDEFFVTDIADAMLLAGLMENLIKQGVTLVTTSNIEPDSLYKNGLQRSKFLPAIELIKENTTVFHLVGDRDFRLRILEQSSIYHSPLDDAAHQNLLDRFQQMAAGCALKPMLMINDRPFKAIQRGDGLIWFEFEELCKKPTGSRDFIEIARAFNTVMISNVPQLTEDDSNASRRFITLVDEFYDRGVKLLLSAEVPVNSLYTGKRLEFEFERTRSRLIEMQSREYLSRPHLA